MRGLFRFFFSVIIIISLLFALPALVNLSQKTTRSVSRATDIPANLTIDVRNILGPMPASFRSFSQGGEEQTRWLEPIVDEVKVLRPRYIRIDHIYDFYTTVEQKDGQLRVDFSQLDRIVDDILATGALPFFSLSYMPPVLSSDGSIIGVPKNWDDWATLVKKTIDHYSGRGERNLNNVYYEVWNEPDLFGHFTMGGDKDYGKLYQYASSGAAGATNTNPFFFGGPAITGPIPGWITNFLTLTTGKNLRLDFLSFHRYHADPSVYDQDSKSVRKIVQSFPRFTKLPLVLSEWGPDSEINPIYDSSESAAMTIATIRRILDQVDLMMTFELKDGPNPEGREFWGRWGVLTHERFGKHAKPRYQDLRLLGQLVGDRLGVIGEGTYVSALSTIDKGVIRVLLVNYDQSGKNSESVPVNIVGLSPGSYRFSESDRTNVIESGDKQAADGKFSKTVLMPPFAIKLLEIYLTQSSLPATTGKPQVSVQLQITPEIIPRPLEFTPPQFLLGRGSIEMTFKFKSDPAENKKVTIFQLPTAGAASSKNEFAASKQNSGFGPRLVFGTFENERPKKTLAASILSWKKDEWHDVIFAWNENGLKLTLDKTIAGELKESFQPGFGTVLTFSDSDLSIGTIRITDGGRELSRRTFAVPTAR